MMSQPLAVRWVRWAQICGAVWLAAAGVRAFAVPADSAALLPIGVFFVLVLAATGGWLVVRPSVLALRLAVALSTFVVLLTVAALAGLGKGSPNWLALGSEIVAAALTVVLWWRRSIVSSTSTGGGSNS